MLQGVIVIDESLAARNSNPENRLAYFREDIGKDFKNFEMG
jgi:hypothetical protein